MSTEQSLTPDHPQIFGGESAKAKRPTRSLGQAMRRGFTCHCPNCGEGKLFRSFLRPVINCSVCNEDYTAQRADDLPAYLTVMIVGHIIVGAFMYVENMGGLSLIGHLAIWTPLTILLSLLLMQPVKGSIIGLQWALFMHGFDPLAEKEFT